jgi:hypothetical protein
MSVPPPVGPPEPQPVPVTIGGSRRPVTLPTWVNVVLVLTLFVSCGANRDTTSDPSPQSSADIANLVVRQLQNVADPSGTGLVSGADVQDLCTLLGAVLDAQKQKVDDVIGRDAATQCADAARAGATR